jgi:hypothetical protein
MPPFASLDFFAPEFCSNPFALCHPLSAASPVFFEPRIGAQQAPANSDPIASDSAGAGLRRIAIPNAFAAVSICSEKMYTPRGDDLAFPRFFKFEE